MYAFINSAHNKGSPGNFKADGGNSFSDHGTCFHFLSPARKRTRPSSPLGLSSSLGPLGGSLMRCPHVPSESAGRQHRLRCPAATPQELLICRKRCSPGTCSPSPPPADPWSCLEKQGVSVGTWNNDQPPLCCVFRPPCPTNDTCSCCGTP